MVNVYVLPAVVRPAPGGDGFIYAGIFFLVRGDQLRMRIGR